MHLDTVDSTNRFVMSRDELLEQDGLVVYADEQTCGRGRFDRRWFGLRGNLFSTVVIHPPSSEFPVAAIPVFVGLALYDTVAGLLEQAQIEHFLSIKWPNDLLLYDRKLAGILCESRLLAGKTVVAAGVGVNLKGDARDFPVELKERIITLQQAGFHVDRDKFLGLFLDNLDTVFSEVVTGRNQTIFKEWCEKSSSIGKRVVFKYEDNDLEGKIHGLDSLGRLMVETCEGDMVTVVSGEVVYQ